jgi:hypothetical protein
MEYFNKTIELTSNFADMHLHLGSAYARCPAISKMLEEN